MRFIAGIIDFISRNPLTTVIILLIAIAAPWLIGAFALVILSFILIGAVSLLVAVWRMKRLGKSFNPGAFRREESMREGDVTIHGSVHEEKRVKDSVGEYVEFKEIKEEK